jgi:hypothetical protein
VAENRVLLKKEKFAAQLQKNPNNKKSFETVQENSEISPLCHFRH